MVVWQTEIRLNQITTSDFITQIGGAGPAGSHALLPHMTTNSTWTYLSPQYQCTRGWEPWTRGFPLWTSVASPFLIHYS